MSGPLVALTGATGFIGSAALRELGRRGVRVRALTRHPGPDADPLVERFTGDLTDPGSLRGLCEGADALLHLASCVSPDESLCEAVNHRGAVALAAEARRAAVPRVVALSTAAVYGPGPHSGPDVDAIRPAPTSPASRTRLAGEAPMLECGAVVLRPGLVLGAGDRWVVPALAELLRRVPARWDGGRGLLSAVDVTDLARLVADLACGPHAVPAGVHHASHPVPVRNGDLMDTLAEHAVLPRAEADWPWQRCLESLRLNPGRMSERQFALLARDHWYASTEIWRAAACPPGPGVLARLEEAAPWYRRHVAPTA
ncbi:NAD-dependent epimerase/dehydratase family protein [Streptomyces sp. NPDC000405]|uniref:NAD-dependent epimerase/dehydratase family protein n=1 Tax=Streptomyces sp. NPDC000405 TaxID=3161033 RepID=UPI00398D4F5D